VKQVLQSLKNGKTEIAEVPAPLVSSSTLLISTKKTLISAGTEKMLVDFGKSNYFQKAKKQPDKLKAVIDKIKTDGLQPTIETVLNKLDQPIPMGYCNVGKVREVGSNVQGFSIGDRVVSNGNHAEVVKVSKNLCAKIPDNVTDDQASFTIIGAIALQGIRLIKPTLGEAIVVTGLGLIGLITIQLLKASGCRVLGIDYDQKKLSLAKKFGAEVVDLSKVSDPLKSAENFSRGFGVDGVIITASTDSNLPIHQAANMLRKRGRIILVGVAGMNMSRDDFYKKEISFQVSSSYGPGRYDPNYEEKGHDYPLAFVRWTEQRNFEAILDMISMGNLNLDPLISHSYEISEALDAYKVIFEERESTLGVLINYSKNIDSNHKNINTTRFNKSSTIEENNNTCVVGFIGSGNYASSVLIPAFRSSGAILNTVSSNNGVSGFYVGRKYRFSKTTTDNNQIFSDERNNAVVIATRHNTHSDLIINALNSNKNIFVEKPLCITMKELENIKRNYEGNSILMVGFNRRFSPHVKKIKSLISGMSGPKSMVITVNAGFIPEDHWTQDPEIGGGRIIGEACHFIDLLRYIADSKIIEYKKISIDSKTEDTVSIQIKFHNGSIGTIHYFSNGSKTFPKERLDVFVDGKVLQLDNFRKLKGFGFSNFKRMNLFRQNKGQQECVEAFVRAIENNTDSPISFEEIYEVSKIAIELSS